MTQTRTGAVVVHRGDYQPPRHRIDTVELRFELDPEATRVRATLRGRRVQGADEGPLELHGEGLDLRSVRLDGRDLSPDEYTATPDALSLSVGATFELETEVVIAPRRNTKLMGLYESSGNMCTQCEAEGFRRITYFLDRPDVMAKYKTTIVGDASRYPVMLSNGNKVEEGTLDDGRSFVTWEDPFAKPSYLFALVAGNLRCHGGRFTTRSGREVELEIWVEPLNIDKCEHALASLQRAMKWDEDVFGLEYDLDIYMIVAVSDFNMGAMENKGLNVFNAKYVLAKPDTATDDDYEDIEAVIAHEYFHNWTGNRVTCRDWFQLTLKEGLTVFRDEQFTADMTSAAVKRISDVRVLRTAQFAQDAGPMAHPIRPESYVEMNNFYTVTVYNKGAEVIRMYHTLLGAEGFRKGMDLYFERHDGQAVTCDDFRAAMADANGADLDQFGLWYSQAGTPVVKAEAVHDAVAKTLTLQFEQSGPPTNGAPYRPMHIPMRMGLLDRSGVPLPLRLAGETAEQDGPSIERVLELRRERESFVFHGVEREPAVSLLRGFSAPVRLEFERTRDELAFLMGNDPDSFSRWDAGQSLMQALLLEQAAGEAGEGEGALVEAFGYTLADPELDGSLKALALVLPDARFLAQFQEAIDPKALFDAREGLATRLARAHEKALAKAYEANKSDPDQPVRHDQASIQRRRLAGLCLGYLCRLGGRYLDWAFAQFESANNMTDQQQALSCLSGAPGPLFDRALATFYARFHDDRLVVDKWFALQAQSTRDDAFERVVGLSGHEAFTLENPNRARSLIGVFAVRNPLRFHDPSGEGHAFVADKVLELDGQNPQVAARIVSAFNDWKRFEPTRRQSQKTQLERIAAHPGLSKDVGEIVGRALK